MQGCRWCQRVWACLSRDVKSIETDNKRKTPHNTQTTAHGETCQERNHITFKTGLHRTVLRCCCLRLPVEKWPPVRVLTPGSEPYLRLEPQSHTPTLIPAESGWTASRFQSDTGNCRRSHAASFQASNNATFLRNQNGLHRSKTSKSLTWQRAGFGARITKAVWCNLHASERILTP